MNAEINEVVSKVLAVQKNNTGASIIASVEHPEGKHIEAALISGKKSEILDLLGSLCTQVLADEPELVGVSFLIDLTEHLMEDKHDNN